MGTTAKGETVAYSPRNVTEYAGPGPEVPVDPWPLAIFFLPCCHYLSQVWRPWQAGLEGVRTGDMGSGGRGEAAPMISAFIPGKPDRTYRVRDLDTGAAQLCPHLQRDQGLMISSQMTTLEIPTL